MNILTVDGLCKHYPGFTLDHVSFSMEAGTVMGFIGRNGAGKTTTLKALLRLVHPDAGKVTLLGLDAAHDEHAIRQQTKQHIATMQQQADAVFNNFLDLVGRPERRYTLPSREWA